MVAAKDWPTHLDFRDALGNTTVCFDDPDLKGGSIPKNGLGFLKASTGGFASVYQVEKGGRRWAVRCFTSPLQSDVAERYAAISKHLVASPLRYMVQFAFNERGVRVEGNLYPTVKMAWVDGESLSRHVANLVASSNPVGLRALAESWRRLCADLISAQVGHGDLQHGNVMVTPSGELRLVDYDGMFVPSLAGRSATELGQPAYQHPKRTKNDFGPDLDRYSALTIFTALNALAASPGLWSRYDNEDNLLFTPADHADPANSPLFGELIMLPGAPSKLAAELAAAAVAPLRDVPTIERALARTTPAVLPGAPGRRIAASGGVSNWWTQAAAAESRLVGTGPVEAFIAAFPAWSRPGLVIVRWTESEPIFQDVVQTEVVIKHPARRLFRKTPVEVHRTERVQTGSRPIPKQQVDQVGANVPGLKGIATTGGVAYGLAANEVISWKLGSDDVRHGSMPVEEITEGIAASNGLVVVASRERLTLSRANSIIRTIPREGNSLYYAVAVSPKATRIAAGLGQKAAVVFDGSSAARLGRLDGFRRKVQALAFLDENRLLVGSDDSTIVLFEVAGRRIATGHDHMLPVVAVAASAAAGLVASADSSGQIHIYSGTDLRNRFAVNLRDEVRSLAFSPVGQFLIAATGEGSIALINTRTGRVEGHLNRGASGHTCSGIAFTDNGDLVTSHDNGLTVLWSTDQKRQPTDLGQVRLPATKAYRTTPGGGGGKPSVATGRAPDCPMCGLGMVVRRRNTEPFTRFWGCPSFPRCKGTRSL